MYVCTIDCAVWLFMLILMHVYCVWYRIRICTRCTIHILTHTGAARGDEERADAACREVRCLCPDTVRARREGLWGLRSTPTPCPLSIRQLPQLTVSDVGGGA